MGIPHVKRNFERKQYYAGLLVAGVSLEGGLGPWASQQESTAAKFDRKYKQFI